MGVEVVVGSESATIPTPCVFWNEKMGPICQPPHHQLPTFCGKKIGPDTCHEQIYT